MILLPYIHRVSVRNNITVHSYIILTIGGIELWNEECTTISDVESYLTMNDLYTESIQIHDNVCLCLIDREKTRITDFYNWNEITDSDTFCWRTLYTFGKDQNWLPHPNESIGGYSYQKLCDMINNI